MINRTREGIRFILLSLGLFLIAAIGTAGSGLLFPSLVLPPFSPSGNTFKFIWLLALLPLMLAAVLIKTRAVGGVYKKDAVAAYWLILILSCIWFYFFFAFKIKLLSLILIAAILYFALITVPRYLKLYPFSGILMIPYVIWIGFVVYFNLFVCILNR